MKTQLNNIAFILCCSLAFNTWGQNLDKIGSGEEIKINGGLTFNTVTYFQSGLTTPRREPFTWFATGNINVSILDVALPFTYAYSNQGSKFTQPFNRTAIHPQYKWFKSHLGVVSMNFSPYTLSGHLFLGGGVELTPGKWNIQAMAGRLQKEIAYDPILDNLNEITYKRWGYGLKLGYRDKGYSGEFIFFKGFDQPNSLPFIPLNSSVKPQDNLVMSLKGSAQIIQGLNLEAEYALSGLTQNRNETNDLNPEKINFITRAINGNATTEFFQAFKTAISYGQKTFKLAFNFEHIDPGYKTLGGYYFNNDLQNFTFAPSVSLLKKKLNIALNTGFQRNNLSELEASTTNRWIGSANISFVPTSKLVLSGNYSNFSTFTRNRPQTDPFYYQPADTLNFYQLTQNAAAMLSYSFGEKDVKHSWQLMYNYQESTNLSGNIQTAGFYGMGLQTDLTGIPTHIHMGNLAYTAQFTKIKAGLTLASNINQSVILDQTATFIGPTLNAQKSLFDKKASISLGSTYNRQYNNQELVGNILNHRMSLTFNPSLKNENFGKVGLSLNANLMQKFAILTGDVDIHEMNIFLNLNYTF